jgi:pimeloyl-ACP methyl ester carboxylesterase
VCHDHCVTSDASTDAATPDQAEADPPRVVLVHGTRHGGWCWAGLQAEFDRRGIASLAVDLPGHGAAVAEPTGPHGDARAVGATPDKLRDRDVGPIVLVGHSYGGAVITQVAAGHDDVDHLVYVAAFAPDTGECPPHAVTAAIQRLSPQPMATMTEKADGSPRNEIDSTYVVCTRGRAVDPDHQMVMAGRCTQRVEFVTDHDPFLSRVDDMASIVGTTARAATQ